MDKCAEVSADLVLAELDRILEAKSFQATDRNRRFLRYVVEETVAGRADRIKAYTIGTSVFGRGDDFDPHVDPIVRIEAGRLRRSLEHHYLLAGGDPELRITIPKGGYVPQFETKRAIAPPAPHSDLHTKAPHVMVRPFGQQCWTTDWADISRTLTLQVISALTRFTDLFVYGFGTAVSLAENDHEVTLHVDYELTGNVTITRTAIRAEFLLQNAHEGRFVWSHSIEKVIDPSLDPAELASLCSGIAGEVAAIIAQRDGILDGEAREMAGKLPARFAAYQKLVEFQDYWRKVDIKRHDALRRDLEQVIVEDPDFAAAHACLSLLYTDAARYGIDCGLDHPCPITRALWLARRAVQLAPRSGRSHHALGVAEWFSGQVDRGLASLEMARSLNPNDSEFCAELGLRSAMRMKWDVGVPMLNLAFERNPLQSGQYRMGLFFYHFAHGDYESAFQQAFRADAPAVAHPQIACAAALMQQGRRDEAVDFLAKAEAIAPGLVYRLAEDLAKRQIHPRLIAMVIDALDPLLHGEQGARRKPRLSRAH